jgi:hypothetical protein
LQAANAALQSKGYMAFMETAPEKRVQAVALVAGCVDRPNGYEATSLILALKVAHLQARPFRA